MIGDYRSLASWHVDSFLGCAGVASRRRAMHSFADLALEIIGIWPVFGRLRGLLICGLKVRFLPGSPPSQSSAIKTCGRSSSHSQREIEPRRCEISIGISFDIT